MTFSAHFPHLDSMTRRLTAGLLGLMMSLLPLVAPATLTDQFNNAVNALAAGPGGITYVGGSFTQAGTDTGLGGVLDATTGLVDRNFPKVVGAGPNPAVYSVVPDGSGGWYIGGSFTEVGGLARNNLAHIDSSGAVTAWNPDANGTVYALALSDGTLYAGGDFTFIGAVARDSLAAIGTNGALGTWNPGASGASSGNVLTLAVDAGVVYIGGGFTGVCTATSTCWSGTPVARGGLAAVGTNGTLRTWNPNANVGGSSSYAVYALAVSGPTVYVGGTFTTLGSNARGGLAAVDTDGTLLSWYPGAVSSFSGSAGVYTLAVSGTAVYVGGNFTSIGGTLRAYAAAIDATNATITAWNPNLSAGSPVQGLVVSGSTVYLAGDFTTIDSPAVTRNYLAAVDAVNGTATAWDPNANGPGTALAVSGSSVYVGGRFSLLNRQARNRLAAIDATGALTAWNPDAGGNVYALAVGVDRVYAGGAFTTIGVTNTRNHLAAVGTDGSLDTWNPNANGDVYALAVGVDRVYAGGAFTTIGGTNRNHLAAVGTDGILDAWNPNANGVVYALALNVNTLYVGGAFNTINGNVQRNLLAAFDTTTGSATAWDPDATGYGVYALAVSGDTVYVGGIFWDINNGAEFRTNLAAVDPSIGLATPWNPGASDVVNALAVGGKMVYVGGNFTSFLSSTGFTPRNRLAAIDMDGTGTLDAWDPDAGGSVNALSVSADTVYAGGQFTTMAKELKNGSPTAYLSFLVLNGPPCGPGIDLTFAIGPPALWQQFALPCVPDAATASVRNVLGTGTTGQLDPLDYNSPNYATGQNWWRLFRRDNTANANVLMPLDGASGSDLLSVGPGYWLKSLDAPAGGGNLVVTGTATPTDPTIPSAHCAVAAGCTAIDLVVAANRYNMVGNPFPYNVDWAQVRIQVDGDTGTSLTPSEAQTADYLDKRIWIWDGTSYYTFDDITPAMVGNLQYAQSFWVKVLPGAVGHTLRLLIPAAASTHAQLAPTGSERLAAARPWYLAWLDALIPTAGASELAVPPDAGQETPGRGPERRPAPRGVVGPAPTDPTIELLTTIGTSHGLDPATAKREAHAQAQAEGREWYLRLKVDEPATGYRDHNSVLGQLLTAQNGPDPHDLGELPPFATPYLTLVFPHPDWGTAAGDYASDYRAAQRLNSRGRPVAGLPAADWTFEIRTDRPGTPVVLTWEGPPEILQRSRLIDRATGRTLIPTAKAYATGYRVTLTSGKGTFTWRYLGQR